MLPADAEVGSLSPGILANNYMFVRGLRSALSTSETNLSAVVKSFRTVIRDGCWRHWLDHNGREVRWNAADFRRFLEAPWPDGCGVPVHLARKMLQGTDVAADFEEMVRGTPGGANNPEGKNQHSEVNRDTVLVDLPSTIPLPSKSKAPTGNSVSYALRRLKRQAPALAEAVARGELSPNAAAIRAGFRVKHASIPIDPTRAAAIIVKHFPPDALARLLSELLTRAALLPGRETAPAPPGATHAPPDVESIEPAPRSL